MKKIELLAPAGNMENLKAAVMAGCDAVYLGGTNFGARAFSKNFSNEEIIEVIKYCHLYGVKVYVTINTLIYESEVDSFMEYVDFLHRNNVDAVLIQDLGMFDLVRKTYPNYIISKNKIELTPDIDVDNVLKSMAEKYKNQPVNTIDGVKIEFGNEWVHLRKSNTEPIIRIYSESQTEEKANELAQKIINDIKSL